MAWTVRQLAEMSGVSVRTLRYYDQIGLVRPAYHSQGGYRMYEEEQMLLLQQVLFFRELGFKLERIKRIVGRSDFDKALALRAQRAVLQKEKGRLDGLIETIDKTIKHLKGEIEMAPKEMYYGLSSERQARYEKELAELLSSKGQEALKQAKRDWSETEWKQFQEEGNQISQALAKVVDHEPESEEVQKLIAQHYRWVCKAWTPDRDSYAELGELYRTHPEFREFYEKFAPGMADFLAKAMAIFARGLG